MKIVKILTPKHSSTCIQLSREWERIILHTGALDKVFVSIKGYYYQAVVQGQPVTWLVPHKFKQSTPQDVDFKVMVTFLQFYETLLRFVNFKLYNDAGLHYPPQLDAELDNSRHGLNAIKLQTKAQVEQQILNPNSSSSSSSSSSRSGVSSSTAKALQSSVNAALKKGIANHDDDDKTDAKQDEAEFDDFSKMDEDANVPTAKDLTPDDGKTNRCFAGLTFVLNREVPQDALEFVIRSADGTVIREMTGVKSTHASDSSVTHQVVDRKTVANQTQGREYVQPQWIFDCFNCKTLLPVEPYRPGVAPPAHLSPFVDDDQEGYVPHQRRVLSEWTGKPSWDTEEAGDVVREQKKQAADNGDSEDEENSSDEDEMPAVDGKAEPRKMTKKEKQLAMIMMSNKEKRLYSRMQYGIAKKKAANDTLMRKRKRLEEDDGEDDQEEEAEEMDVEEEESEEEEEVPIVSPRRTRSTPHKAKRAKR
jgi:pescadillo protein